MARSSTTLVLLSLLTVSFIFAAPASAAWGASDDAGPVSLDKVRSLTFVEGKKTNSRRVAPVDSLSVRWRHSIKLATPR